MKEDKKFSVKEVFNLMTDIKFAIFYDKLVAYLKKGKDVMPEDEEKLIEELSNMLKKDNYDNKKFDRRS